ncbi:MAG: DNA cytosine methyltransferase [Alistipes senegalensis]|nr:DNA cytosine methyltransferase [Alistipes senegalensis]
MDNGKFKFPKPFDNGIRLKDVLEDEVEEKYYLSDTMINGFIKHNSNHLNKGTGFIWQPRDYNGVASTLRANSALCPTDNTIMTCLVSKQGKQFEHETKETNTILARDYKGFGNQRMNAVIENTSKNFRIRKLTPKECWRLMGFPDGCFDLAKNAGVSNSQLYKQAGNSIVVNVLYYIYWEIYKVMPYLFENLKLTSLFSGIGAFEIALDKFYYNLNTVNFIQPAEELNTESNCGENKPTLVGGVGTINFGKQYRQGNRVYDSNSIAMCLLSQPVGNAGGNSYLYLVDNSSTNKLIQEGTINKPEWIEARRRVYSPNGVCPTLNGVGQGGNTEPKILEVGKLDIKGKDQIKRVYDADGVAPTLSTMQGGIKSQK